MNDPQSATEPTFRFQSVRANFSIYTPVLAAKEIHGDWRKKQINSAGELGNMARCPGMYDFAGIGYIVVAHCDIHIKANRAGTLVQLGRLPNMSQEDRNLLQPANFAYDMVDGMTELDPGIQGYAMKIPLPFACFAQEGWSAHVMPALMHSPFLRDLFVVPGTIDYDRFHTMNFIAIPQRECELTIWAGTPLLHILPFKREQVTATCAKATEEEKDRINHVITSQKKGFYRKNILVKKEYPLVQQGTGVPKNILTSHDMEEDEEDTITSPQGASKCPFLSATPDYSEKVTYQDAESKVADSVDSVPKKARRKK